MEFPNYRVVSGGILPPRSARVTDPLNNHTVLIYDNLNRVTQEQNELGYTRMNSYDAVNNLTSRTDRNGRRVTYGYDQLDRRTSETWSGSSYVASYTYDLADQLTQASDGVVTYGYVYDGLGRTTTVTSTLGGSGMPGPVPFVQQFDLAGDRTRLAATVAGTLDFRSVFTYDGLNRLTRVTQAAQTGGNAVAEKRVDFAYATDSQWQTITRYQDLAGTKLVAGSTFGYDQAGRLQGLTHAQNATTLAAFTWSYDTANRVSGFTNTLYPAESATYTYDAASQLTGADRSGTGGDETYTYDANGNRANHSTGVDNRLQSDGTYNFTYDNEGNRTRRTKITGGEVTEYQWDHRNRLVRVTVRTADNGPLTKDTLYTYDVFDRRVAKQVDLDGSGPQAAWKEYYIYDGQHIALKFVDPDASGPQPSTLRSRLVHGAAVDQILADEVVTSTTSPGNVLWPLTDNLGTVRDVVDFNATTNASQVVNHLTYDSFGRVTAETNAAVDFLFAFTGRERDEETGLYYYRARNYDPATGRFLSQDPIGFEAQDPNLYRYVENGPTNATDPSGLESIKVGPENKRAQTTALDASGNTWMVEGTYVSERGTGYMELPGSTRRYFSQFTLKVTFIPAKPEKADCRIKLAGARQVYPFEAAGDLGDVFVDVGQKKWSMFVDNYIPRFSGRTDYFLGINPEDAERGTLGSIPALNSDEYSIYPRGRHSLDAFDHAWIRFERSLDELERFSTASREYVIGAYCQKVATGTWPSFVPLRVLYTRNTNDSRKWDMTVVARQPVRDSATFNKARARFEEVIGPLRR